MVSTEKLYYIKETSQWQREIRTDKKNVFIHQLLCNDKICIYVFCPATTCNTPCFGKHCRAGISFFRHKVYFHFFVFAQMFCVLLHLKTCDFTSLVSCCSLFQDFTGVLFVIMTKMFCKAALIFAVCSVPSSCIFLPHSQIFYSHSPLFCLFLQAEAIDLSNRHHLQP